ncbi:MAG: threonine/serine dehydratase [Candidatus Bathyarchaeia archaeon]
MITLQDVLKAQNTIKGHVTRTPTQLSQALSQRTGAEVYLKLETVQPIRAFKIRGALNKISSLTPTERDKGVITASTGNHGLAVAYSARLFGLKAVIYVPEDAVEEKVDAIERLGAEVVRVGRDYQEAYLKSLESQRRTGATYLHSYNDPLVIAGQGTIGLELLEDVPDIDTVIVPVGGGGLISGVGMAAKTIKPNIRIIGVQAAGAPAMYDSWKEGRIVERPVKTIADGLASRKPLKLTFEMVKRYVDDIVLVTDDEMVEAMRLLIREEHLLAEPSGAAALAALLFRHRPKPGEKVALIVSGANVSTDLLGEILGK